MRNYELNAHCEIIIRFDCTRTFLAIQQTTGWLPACFTDFLTSSALKRTRNAITRFPFLFSFFIHFIPLLCRHCRRRRCHHRCFSIQLLFTYIKQSETSLFLLQFRSIRFDSIPYTPCAQYSFADEYYCRKPCICAHFVARLENEIQSNSHRTRDAKSNFH